jgi:hypothetical protein
VLEEVGESGAPRPFVLRADVVPEIDRGERQPAIDVQDDPEAVRQAVAASAALDLRRFTA